MTSRELPQAQPDPPRQPDVGAGEAEKAPGFSADFSTWILPPLKHVCYLTGPTSSGKTSLALAVARRLDAEIISLDSMAIYRGMDIGTAKPSPAQRAEVPHHLIDILEPTETFSVSNFVQAAHRVANEIFGRDKRVLVCGGTPLYLKSLIRGMFLGPPADWPFRAAIEADLQEFGEEALRQRLSQVDPLLAHKLHPHDHRRMIRGLEVARITGRPLSHWQHQFETPALPAECPVTVLRLERAWLHDRINHRVESMIERGLKAEVESLLDRYGKLGRTAAQAVGYREMLDHLQSDVPWEETIQHIKAHTRQFARRQEIWFRGLKELIGIAVTPSSRIEELADEIANVFRTVAPTATGMSAGAQTLGSNNSNESAAKGSGS